MTDEEYNGWANRETWAVVLHIDNDEGLYLNRCKLCEKVARDNFPHGNRNGVLANLLRDWVASMAEDVYFPEGTPTKALLGMFNDIGSLWRVDWDEIARNWLTEYPERPAP